MAVFGIIGNRYKGNNYCDPCIAKIAAEEVFSLDDDLIVLFDNEAMDKWASLLEIDPTNAEDNWSSDHFPHNIFEWEQDEILHCETCKTILN